MSVNLKRLGARAGIGLSAAAGLAVKQPEMLRTVSGWVELAVLAFLVAVPWEPESAGVLRPAVPGQVSLAGKVGAAVQTLISTPAANRRQKAKDMAVQGFEAALADPAMREKLKQELTQEMQRARLWQPGQPAPADAPVVSGGMGATAEAIIPVTPIPVAPTVDPAITQTGGNQ